MDDDALAEVSQTKTIDAVVVMPLDLRFPKPPFGPQGRVAVGPIQPWQRSAHRLHGAPMMGSPIAGCLEQWLLAPWLSEEWHPHWAFNGRHFV